MTMRILLVILKCDLLLSNTFARLCISLCSYIRNLTMVFKDNFLCCWPQFAGKESKWGFSYSSYSERSQISIYVLGQTPPPPQILSRCLSLPSIYVLGQAPQFIHVEFWTVRKPGGNQLLHLWTPAHVVAQIKIVGTGMFLGVLFLVLRVP